MERGECSQKDYWPQDKKGGLGTLFARKQERCGEFHEKLSSAIRNLFLET